MGTSANGIKMKERLDWLLLELRNFGWTTECEIAEEEGYKDEQHEIYRPESPDTKLLGWKATACQEELQSKIFIAIALTGETAQIYFEIREIDEAEDHPYLSLRKAILESVKEPLTMLTVGDEFRAVALATELARAAKIYDLALRRIDVFIAESCQENIENFLDEVKKV